MIVYKSATLRAALNKSKLFILLLGVTTNSWALNLVDPIKTQPQPKQDPLAATLAAKPKLPLEKDIKAEDNFDLKKYVCTDNASEAGRYGIRACTEIQTQAAETLRKIAGAILAHYYDGNLIEPDYRKTKTSGYCSQIDADKKTVHVQTPICALTDPDAPNGGEISKNWKGESCFNAAEVSSPSEGYCDLKNLESQSAVPSGLTDCPREEAWLNGAGVLALKSKMQEVLKEISGPKMLQLKSKVGNSDYLCGSYFIKIKKLVEGFEIKENDTSEENRFNGIKNIEAKLKAVHTRQTDELSDKSYAFDDKQDCTKQMPSGDFDVQKYLAGNTNNPGSVAFCQLNYSRRYVELQFMRLAACEMQYRYEKARADFDSQRGKYIQELFTNHVLKCKAQAYMNPNCAPKDLETVFTKPACRSIFYSCYKPAADNYLKGIMNSAFPVEKSNPLFYDYTKPVMPEGPQKGKEMDISTPCALMVAAWRRRKTKGTRKRAKRSRNALILLVAILSLAISSGAFATDPPKLEQKDLIGHTNTDVEKDSIVVRDKILVKCPANSAEKNFQYTIDKNKNCIPKALRESCLAECEGLEKVLYEKSVSVTDFLKSQGITYLKENGLDEDSGSNDCTMPNTNDFGTGDGEACILSKSDCLNVFEKESFDIIPDAENSGKCSLLSCTCSKKQAKKCRYEAALDCTTQFGGIIVERLSKCKSECDKLPAAPPAKLLDKDSMGADGKTPAPFQVLFNGRNNIKGLMACFNEGWDDALEKIATQCHPKKGDEDKCKVNPTGCKKDGPDSMNDDDTLANNEDPGILAAKTAEDLLSNNKSSEYKKKAAENAIKAAILDKNKNSGNIAKKPNGAGAGGAKTGTSGFGGLGGTISNGGSGSGNNDTSGAGGLLGSNSNANKEGEGTEVTDANGADKNAVSFEASGARGNGSSGRGGDVGGDGIETGSSGSAGHGNGAAGNQGPVATGANGNADADGIHSKDESLFGIVHQRYQQNVPKML